VTHALITKKELGFVNNTLEMHSQVKKPLEFDLWNQCNSMILSLLTYLVEQDIVVGMVHAKTARQVWEDLYDQFLQKNAVTIYQIQKSITTIT